MNLKCRIRTDACASSQLKLHAKERQQMKHPGYTFTAWDDTAHLMPRCGSGQYSAQHTVGVVL